MRFRHREADCYRRPPSLVDLGSAVSRPEVRRALEEQAAGDAGHARGSRPLWAMAGDAGRLIPQSASQAVAQADKHSRTEVGAVASIYGRGG